MKKADKEQMMHEPDSFHTWCLDGPKCIFGGVEGAFSFFFCIPPLVCTHSLLSGRLVIFPCCAFLLVIRRQACSPWTRQRSVCGGLLLVNIWNGWTSHVTCIKMTPVKGEKKAENSGDLNFEFLIFVNPPSWNQVHWWVVFLSFLITIQSVFKVSHYAPLRMCVFHTRLQWFLRPTECGFMDVRFLFSILWAAHIWRHSRRI